jgi:gamma-glutamylcyclotransferase (GGCT)/AIG2-like uncharacterized protein YtfP
MILESTRAAGPHDFLRGRELKSLVALEPQIMNHDTLVRRRYKPDVEIPTVLLKSATEEHRKLVHAFRQLESDISDEVADRVLKRLALLLYIVRSNIAHREKTPYGPDPNKINRDEGVCAAVVPVEVELVDILLGSPRTKLVVYGTLAPGESNHSVLGSVPGDWRPCWIKGSITIRNALPCLSWNPSNDEIPAKLFTSTELASKWKRLDSFEGTSYRRRLIPVQTDTGMEVANAYLAR